MRRFNDTTLKSMFTKLRAGDEITWSYFYQTYSALIHIRGLDFVNNPAYNFDYADLDELMSCVMVKFFNMHNEFTYSPEKGRFQHYFRRIIDYTVIDIVRKKRNNLSMDDNPQFDILDDNDDQWTKQWQTHIFEQAMLELNGRMDERAMQAFSLCKLNGESPRDVAKFLKVSLATVYNDCNAVWKELKATANRLKDEY